MGFFDTLGNLVGKANEKAGEVNQEVQEKQEEFRRYDNEILMQRARSGSFTTRVAAFNILKERGVVK